MIWLKIKTDNMAKGPFKLKSQSAVKKGGFKAKGSWGVKHPTAKTHFHSTDRQDTTDIVADPKMADVKTKTKEDIKNEQSQTRLDQATRSLDLKEREILLKEKAAEPKKETKKVSIEQQLADRKLKDLEKEQLRLGEKGHIKGWSDKKLARKEKRLGKKIKKAKKMTDPLNRYERDLDRAKAADIFDAASSGRVVTRRQDALKKGFDHTQTIQDVETTKKGAQSTLHTTDTFTNSGGYTSGGEDIMGEKLTSTDVTGKYDAEWMKPDVKEHVVNGKVYDSEGNFLRDDK